MSQLEGTQLVVAIVVVVELDENSQLILQGMIESVNCPQPAD